MLNKVNGKQYIGITLHSLKRRWNNHKAAANGSSQVALHKAIRKYGVENFSIQIVGRAKTVKGLNEIEIELIRFFNCRGSRGYNMTNGGDGTHGMTHSQSTRDKISLAGKGRKMSDETKRKLSVAHTGKKLSEEHKKKLSQSKIGKHPIRTAEHQAKIIASRRINREAREALRGTV